MQARQSTPRQSIESMATGAFVEEMMREQSLLEQTCGDLFDHIDDLLDFSKEESAADVLLLDAPAPGSPLSARIIDVGARTNASAAAPPPAVEETAMMAPAQDAFFDAAAEFVGGGPKDGAHIGSVRFLSQLVFTMSRRPPDVTTAPRGALSCRSCEALLLGDSVFFSHLLFKNK